MIRFKLREMIEKKAFRENVKITIEDVAKESGIHRVTLSKMINQRGYNTGTDNLDKLCRYFSCTVADLIEYVPEGKLID